MALAETRRQERACLVQRTVGDLTQRHRVLLGLQKDQERPGKTLIVVTTEPS